MTEAKNTSFFCPGHQEVGHYSEERAKLESTQKIAAKIPQVCEFICKNGKECLIENSKKIIKRTAAALYSEEQENS